MNKPAVFMALFAIVFTPSLSHAGDHKAGDYKGVNQSCFYDSKHGKNGWRYYFCGAGGKGDNCAGKEAGGRSKAQGGTDEITTLKRLERFTFLTAPNDSYCCCSPKNGTVGRFVKPVNDSNCYTNDEPREEIINKGNGKFCKELIYKTVCGDEERIKCSDDEDTWGDYCEQGTKWRGNECAPICTGDTVYENKDSNKCIQCPTTSTQGRKDKDAKNKPLTDPYCVKCNASSHVFDKENQECVAKTAVPQYSKSDMKACSKCPSSMTMKLCLQAQQSAQKAQLNTEADILSHMDRVAEEKEPEITSITNTCYMHEKKTTATETPITIPGTPSQPTVKNKDQKIIKTP